VSYSDKDEMIADINPVKEQAVQTARILIVETRPEVSSMLAELADKEFGESTSLQANSIEKVVESLAQYNFELAIMGFSDSEKKPWRIEDEIKLCRPAIPILAAKINNAAQEFDSLRAGRILAGIRYVKSLSKCGLRGFTVVVNG